MSLFNAYASQVMNVLKRSQDEGLDALVETAAEKVASALIGGRRVLVCGNGGSFADALHIAGELVGRFKEPYRKAYPVIALGSNGAALTANANDLRYGHVFEREVNAFGQSGGVLLAISTSGGSRNVYCAVRAAQERMMYTIGLLGKDGGRVKSAVDLSIVVPHDETPVIQAVHSVIYHALCDRVDRRLKENEDNLPF